METLLLIDACKRSMANTINLIMPCYPYARQDKKENSREPISAKLFANMLTTAGITRLIVMDLHASQIQGFFDIPVDNIYSLRLVIQHINKHLFNNMSIEDKQKKYIVVSPDAGATKRTLKFAEHMHLNTIIMHKQRNYEKENTIDNTILIGDNTNLKNKTAIICDDMCDTGGTLIKVVENLELHGIKNVIVIITHGIFSGKCIERFQDCKIISKIIVSDTICQNKNKDILDKLEIFSISELMGNVITNIIKGGSLSLLFE
jgi:ribose-phosphate pyrophosphokinase